MKSLRPLVLIPVLALAFAASAALRASSSPTQSAARAEAAPGVVAGARVLLLRGAIEEVFVVREVAEPYARLELDLAWARGEEGHPLLTGLLERGEQALEGLDRDELEGLLARLRGAKEGLEDRSERSAEERVEVTRTNALWVNFASVERYLVLSAEQEAEREAGEDR